MKDLRRPPFAWQHGGRPLAKAKQTKKPGDRQATGRVLCSEYRMPAYGLISRCQPSFDRFSPIQRIRPRPRASRLIQPVAGTDEIVGGNDIFGRVRHHPAPSIAPGPAIPARASAAIAGRCRNICAARRRGRNIRSWGFAWLAPCRQRRPAPFREKRATNVPGRTPEWVPHRRRSGGGVLPACPRYHRHRHRPRESGTLAGL